MFEVIGFIICFIGGFVLGVLFMCVGDKKE